MLDVIIFTILAEKWIYSPYTIPTKLEESLETPILAAIVSHRGYRSHQINNTFHIVAELLESKLPLIHTQIDCSRSHFCDNYKIGRSPKICLLRTNHWQYWRCTDEIDIPGILNYFKYELQGNIIQKNLYSFSAAEYVKGGGILVFVEIPSNDTKTLPIIQRLSIIYKIFDVNFIYSIVEAQLCKLTIYYSSSCKESRLVNNTSISSILQDKLFSYYHHYFNEELMELPNVTLMLYVGHESKTEQKETILSALANNDWCKPNLRIGFSSIKSNRYIASLTGRNSFVHDYVVGLNKKTECYSIIHNVSAVNVTKYIEELSNGNKCDYKFKKSFFSVSTPLLIVVAVGFIAITMLYVFISYILTKS